MKSDIWFGLICGLCCGSCVGVMGTSVIVSNASDSKASKEAASSSSSIWERLDRPGSSYQLQRTRTPGGWLISYGEGLVYVPDAACAWLGTQVEAN